MKRVSSMEFLPPSMSELRVALLGSGLYKREVVNILLPETGPKGVPNDFRRLTGGRLVLINTPDLRPNDMTTYTSYDDFVKKLEEVSDPGPHVFLLVLQPDDFGEQHEQMFCRVLKSFNEKSFNRVLILRSTPRVEQAMEKPSWKTMIRKCRYRYLDMKNLEASELLTRLGQITEENNEEHVSYEAYEDSQQSFSAASGPVEEEESGLMRELPAPQFILLRETASDLKELRKFLSGMEGNIKALMKPESRGEPLKILGCEFGDNLSSLKPGPKLFLLLIEPKKFSLEQKQKLQHTLVSTGQVCFPHSIVVLTSESKKSNILDLIHDCGGRCSTMDKKGRSHLKDLIEKTLLVPQETIRQLNLVFWGSNEARGAAVKTVLGESEHQPVSSPVAVRHQTYVSGYHVSISELCDTSGKTQKQVRRETFQHISQYDPEGVHAFIVVLPVRPRTDEEKQELQTLQNTFGQRVIIDFALIVFTVECNMSNQDVYGFLKESQDLQDLIKSCGERYIVMNITTEHQVPELLRTVHNMGNREGKLCLYTTDMFVQAQIEKMAELERLTSSNIMSSAVKEQKTPECLRIVLVGRTGNGKSSSGNTIVGTKVFRAESSQTSVTKTCEKVRGAVNGRAIEVVDTPGLFDTTLSNKEIHDELVSCMSLLAPGPHVFLLVLQVGRFTQEEKDTQKLIREVFGEKSKDFTMILLTRGDSLVHDELSLKDYIREKCDDSFKKLLSDCGDRTHVFNNYSKDRSQVEELLTKVDSMVAQTGGSCFTNEMLEEAEASIKKRMEKILQGKEEEMKKEIQTFQQMHDEQIQELKKQMQEQRAATDAERKVMEERLRKEREDREKEELIRKEKENAKRDQEEIEKHQWKIKLEELEREIESQSIEKKCIDGRLMESREQMRKEKQAWEEERQKWWENLRQEEEKTRETERRWQVEKEELEKKRELDEKIRKEKEERDRQELQENFNKRIEELKSKHEEEARIQAEEFNEFREKYSTEKRLLLEQNEELKEQKEKAEGEKEEQEGYVDLLRKIHKREKEELEEKHRKEMERRRCSLM